MKKGDVYKGFRVLESIENVKDCNAPGVWLKHERTGMEIFHVLKDDDENLFAFVFRTPPKDSTGAAHIMEHSVLCGSEKYPLKDPFIRLANQSLATYLNAFTSPDYTAYPSSSTVKADYFNTLSVYADAVFFPLLKEEIFMQEGHRLEFDQKGKASIQGVVYNEMKGKYSSYESVISDAIDNVMFAGTRYSNDSGGDPMEIPSLTYSQFKAFHKKHYTCANCLVFLYGNIPTEEQIDFIDENVLSKIKDGGKKVKYGRFPENAKIPSKAHVYGPANENETKDTVVCAWKIEPDNMPRNEHRMELMFLNNLLWNTDSAPVTKALMESSLGEDIAPQTGMSLSLQCHNAVCGLRGCNPKDSVKIKKVVFDALEKLCTEGLSKSLLDRVCMTFDFYNREISRSGGPQGFVMLRRCIRGWIYDEKPWKTLEMFDDFAKLKERLQKEPEYLSEMIHRYFLDNKNFSLITASPSKKWLSERAAQEKENTRIALENLTEKKALKKLEKMSAFQQYKETEEEDNLIPRLKRNQLELKFWESKISKSNVSGIQVFTSTEPTNGIIYFDLCLSIDNLTPEEYKYASLIASTCTDVGWGSVSWSEGLNLQQTIAGSLVAHTESMSLPVINRRRPDCSYVGRDWFMFSVSVLEDKIEQSLDLISDILLKTDYSDSSRLMDLINSSVNSDKSSFASYATQYAYSRSKRKVNRNEALKELWNGLSSVYTSNELSKKKPEEASKIFRALLKKITGNGAVIHVVSTEDGVKKTKKLLPDFIKKMNLQPLGEKKEVPLEKLIKLTELPGEILNPASKKKCNPDFVDEVVLINGTVGSACSSFRSDEYGKKSCASEAVFCHRMANNELWETIRTKGGAYGVNFNSTPSAAYSFYGTYRDPKPFDSASAIKKAVAESKENVYSEDEVEKSVIGRYAALIEPMTPCDRGMTAFIYELQGRGHDEIKKNVAAILSVTAESMKKAAKRYAERIMEDDGTFSTVIFCPKSLFSAKNKENTGKIISLPL